MAPSVREFYNGKSVLITGATGFIGKVLLEKLLRSCTGIDTVYLLLRPKKGVIPEERLRELCNVKLFRLLRDTNPEAFNKIKLIPGDILKEDLGLSNDDRVELQRRCNIIFHSAACVRFDQKIKDAVQQNNVGTLRMLQLAENLENLEAFIHLSTAYCHCNQEVLEEKIYPTLNPHRVIKLTEWLDDDLLNYLEPKLIAGEPNTYSYTKAVSENLVSEYGSKFPVAIARASIVIAALKEPIPGWVDNLNGPTGILIGAGKGVIRTMHCESTYDADALPVDVVVNALILVAYAVAIQKPREAKVYNLTLSGAMKYSWADIIKLSQKWINVYPPTAALWYPGGSIKSYWITHQIDVIFTHLLPAFLIDILLFVLGQKTFMVKLQKRITHGLTVLQSYTTKHWIFKNENFLSLREMISDEENNIFTTDVSNANINEYLKNYVISAREFCGHEDLSTLPRARKLHRIRFIADVIFKVIFYGFLAWLIYDHIYIFTGSLELLDNTLKSWSPISQARAGEIESND